MKRKREISSQDFADTWHALEHQSFLACSVYLQEAYTGVHSAEMKVAQWFFFTDGIKIPAWLSNRILEFMHTFNFTDYLYMLNTYISSLFTFRNPFC